MNKEASTVSTAPALGVSFQLPLDDKGRNLVFQTHTDALAEPEAINAVLDKMVNAGERIYARYELKRLRLDLRALNDHVERTKENIKTRRVNWEREHVLRSRKGDWTPTPAQAQEENNDRNTLEQLAKRVKLTEEEIEKMAVTAGE